MILPAIFFMVFAVAGYIATKREPRDISPWRIVPPVLLAATLSVWRGLSGDAVLDLILTVLLAVFAASAGGLLAGFGMGRLMTPKRSAS